MTPEPTPEPVVIPDEPTPLAEGLIIEEIVDEPAPLAEEPDVEEIPDEEVPLAELPGEELTETPDEDVPLADLSPQTGDTSFTALWMLCSLLSLAGIVLLGRKHEGTES